MTTGYAGDVARTRHVGGRDGWYLARCVCGQHWWGDNERRAREPAAAHMRDLGFGFEDGELGTVRWFGASWLAPVCRADAHINTPLGELCLQCEEALESGDQGIGVPFMSGQRPRPEPRMVWYHLRCWLEAIGAPNMQEPRT